MDDATKTSTTSHAHAWEPMPNEMARYRCACGATGFRKNGVIQPHKKRLREQGPEIFSLAVAVSNSSKASGCLVGFGAARHGFRGPTY